MKNSAKIYEGGIVAIQLDRKDNLPLYTVLDIRDFNKIRRLDIKWCVHAASTPPGKWYVRGKHRIHYPNGIELHRLIMKTPQGRVVDHWDNDGLNNRRYNLRNVTMAVNSQNQHGHTKPGPRMTVYKPHRTSY